MINKLLPFAIFGASLFNAQAESSSLAFIEQLDNDLNKKVLSRYINKKKANATIKLAMEEDLNADYKNNYLLSDEMLGLLRKKGVLGSPFAYTIEAFQNHIDSLKSEEEKIEAISIWKSLWLDKVSEHIVYLKSLKKVFTYDLTQSLNYDSNLKLENGDDSFSGASDVGGGLGLGVNFRPFINTEKNKDWSYRARVSASQTFQAEEDNLQYQFLNIGNSFTLKDLHSSIKSLNISLSGTLAYNAGTDDRREFNQFILNNTLTLLPFEPNKFFDYFQSGIQQVGFRIKSKHETPDSAGTPEANLLAFTLSYSQSYVRSKKNQPVQTLKWTLKAENQTLDHDSTRDYQYLGLLLNYTRDLSDLTDMYDLNWVNYGSLRLKNWNSPAVNDREDEEEFLISTGVQSVWTNYFSSTFNVSYRKRQQGVNGNAGNDIDQWRVVLSNTILCL